MTTPSRTLAFATLLFVQSLPCVSIGALVKGNPNHGGPNVPLPVISRVEVAYSGSVPTQLSMT